MSNVKRLWFTNKLAVALVAGVLAVRVVPAFCSDRLLHLVSAESSGPISVLQDKGASFLEDDNRDLFVTIADAVCVPGVPWRGTDDDLKMLTHVPRVVDLDLSIRVGNPTALEFLSHMRNLKHLHVTRDWLPTPR